MPYEIVITNMWDMSEDVIPFGDDKATARLVFDKTWNGLLRDGFVSVHNASNEHLIQYWKKGEDVSQSFFIELREAKPKYDFANLFACIKILAMAKHNRKFGYIWATVAAENNQKAVKEAKHIANVTMCDGRKEVHPLDDDRLVAIRQFNDMVKNHEYNGGRVWRGLDSLMKYMVIAPTGTTTLEFVEVK